MNVVVTKNETMKAKFINYRYEKCETFLESITDPMVKNFFTF